MESLVDELAESISGRPHDAWVRVAVDGAPAAEPGELADRLVAPLRVRGRTVLRVSAADFLRPASLRLEFGRSDPDVFYDEWLDTGALVREVLEPLGPGRSGKVLPALWDSEWIGRFGRRTRRCPPEGCCCSTGRCCWAGGCRSR